MSFSAWVMANEAVIRVTFFSLVFALVGIWELRSPSRELHFSKRARWLNNLSLVVLNTLILRLLFPAAAVGVALYSESRDWGLLRLLPVADWLLILLAVVILDFVIWLQHVMV
ncbi:MAG: sterol desaturase family protein, partial [Gammaproteobacteria bacterium]|nr:sterol desaturase family protein [Gammaproteobacteria bacterium]